MAKSLKEQLESVQEAIDAIESGKTQSYELEGRKLTYVDLPTLYKREESLINRIEKYGGSFIPGQNSKPVARRVRVVFSE